MQLAKCRIWICENFSEPHRIYCPFHEEQFSKYFEPAKKSEVKMADKFWMVYGDGAGAPKYRHASYDSAAAEATRLAKIDVGRRFFVLEAMTEMLKTDVQVRQLGGLNERPF